ncbi:toxin-antitoxin system YwqK family antitoxin [Paraburkholderia gardini]|uniref:toxin-antitoxin system YwqK family antitoxin n=1 Tax=Paraburkholderia gardini TaxID=2823469 RepID=UPI001D277B9B|nr:toxin-antitoxin system YwqK family antitoxin [Paraburkholderia gardini]CAG4912123.1 hypothetical protein R69919_03965 [Paraburkholderia gardini]
MNAATLPVDSGSPASATRVVDVHDDAGHLVTRMSFAGDVQHGEMVRYGPGGTVLLNAMFALGALSGPLRAFDASGAPLIEAHYVDGKLHGLVTTWQKGALASRQHYALGVLNGESLSYAPGGLVTLCVKYVKGVPDGEALFMHDGVVVRRVRYRLGVLEGESLDYAEDGALSQVSPYRADLLDGTVRRYGPDGQVMQERRYVRGKPQGAWRAISATGDAAAAPRLTERLERWVRG